MQELDDNALLREYVERDSQEAFAALVERHVDKVYSVALRQTRNPSHAEEITQVVFVILAQKSRKLGRKVILSGWLYQAARLTATTFIRSEIRRARREQEAYMQSTVDQTSPEIWGELSPLIDGVIGKLDGKDRDALVLRFFDGKSMQEVGAVLGASEDAAKMRVSRALEKIRKILVKRGFDCTTSVLAEQLSVNSICIAPAALTKSATAVALTKGAGASSSNLALIKGALKIMAWTKTKIAVTAAVMLAITGTGVTGYKVFQAHRSTDSLVSSAEIGSDGIIRSRYRVEIVNHSGEMMPANSSVTTFSGADIEQLADDRGQDMKFTKVPGTFDHGVFTNLNKYVVTLNRPVPPGGRIIWIARCKMDGRKVVYLGRSLIQPTGTPGEFELSEHEEYDFAETLHVKGVCRLPPGAVLLDKEPADLMVVTNHGQVEVRFDGMLPPPQIADSRVRYRLASAAQ